MDAGGTPEAGLWTKTLQVFLDALPIGVLAILAWVGRIVQKFVNRFFRRLTRVERRIARIERKIGLGVLYEYDEEDDGDHPIGGV